MRPATIFSIALRIKEDNLEHDHFIETIENVALLMIVGNMKEQEAVNSLRWARDALDEIVGTS